MYWAAGVETGSGVCGPKVKLWGAAVLRTQVLTSVPLPPCPSTGGRAPLPLPVPRPSWSVVLGCALMHRVWGHALVCCEVKWVTSSVTFRAGLNSNPNLLHCVQSALCLLCLSHRGAVCTGGICTKLSRVPPAAMCSISPVLLLECRFGHLRPRGRALNCKALLMSFCFPTPKWTHAPCRDFSPLQLLHGEVQVGY